LRNVAIGLGNAPYSPIVVHALQTKLNDVTVLVQEHILWALKQQEKRAGDLAK
jgi:epoxyqueuosine reductase